MSVMLKWFRAVLTREGRLFELFTQHSRVVVEVAEELKALLAGKDGIERHCARIIDLETEATEITRQVLLTLRRSIITPFGRGDINELIQSMGDAVGMIHKAVKKIRLFEQSNFEPRMREMGVLTGEAAGLIAEAVPLLNRVGTHSAWLAAILEEIALVEGRAAELHDQGLKELFQRHGKSDTMAYIVGAEIYGGLQKAVDSLQDVADQIGGIVIENVS